MTFLSDFELGCSFYEYQEQALTSLRERYLAGQHQLLLLAPPGSGKTLMGLSCALRFQKPTLILTPNTMLQSQWLQQFTHHAASLSGLNAPEEIVDTDPLGQPEILSLTYQRLGAAFRKQQETDEPSPLFKQLQKYSLIILDECHHVLLQWGESLLALIQSHDGVTTTLGLTATPPIERKAHEQKRLWQLVGQVDHEISLPSMIRSGHLSPFQDLVYLVRPNPQETLYISSAHAALHRIQARWSSAEALPAEQPTLALFAETWLLENASQADDLNMLMSCLRYLYHQGIYVTGAPWLPEQEEPLTMNDRAALLGAYALAYLDAQSEDFARFKQTLSLLGYRYRQGRFFAVQGEVEKVLGLSQSKMTALRHILEHEYQTQDQELRVLVMADFALTSAPGESRALKGVLDPDAGGALGIYRFLCRELPDLHPLMMTGSYVFCHASILSDCLAFLSVHLPEHTIEPEAQAGGFFSLQATPEWSPHDYVGVLTQFFETEKSLCLVGTRALLGEGWNCQRLNTLVDLTRVTTYVSVNQIRGRSLRKDTKRPLKVANQWDIVAMIPELESGFKDLEYWQRKHKHFYGLCDDGLIEKGVGHVHAIFDHFDPEQLQHQMEGLNENALERAANRLTTYDGWQVGKAYKDREQHTLQIMPHVKAASVTSQEHSLPSNTLPIDRQRCGQRLRVELQTQAQQFTLSHWVSQSLVWGGAWYLEYLWSIGAIVFSLGVLGGHYGLKYVLSQRLHKQWKVPTKSLVEALAQALWKACLALEHEGQDMDAETLKTVFQQMPLSMRIRQDGSFRFVSEASELRHQTWQQAFQELLSPLLSQRYWLRLELPSENTEAPVFLPVPFVFGRSRKKALIFKAYIENVVGPSSLVFTRRGEGREISAEHQMQRCLSVKTQAVSVWF